MKDRLLLLITRFGFTATRLADELGVQRSGISHILSGRNQPSYDFMVKLLSRFPDINAEWLLLGKGSMYKPSNEDAETQVPAKSKPYPLKPEEDLFTTQPKTPETIIQPENKSNVTSVTSIEQVILLHSDQTFSIYKQAGKV